MCSRQGWRALLLLAALVMVSAPGCAHHGSDAKEPVTLLGTWYVEYIRERPVVDRSPARLTFENDGKLSGNASCNQLVSQFARDGNRLEIGNAAVTRKMCVEALMEQEQRFLAALGAVASYRFENGLLILEDVEGTLQFKASPTQ